jgi:hypothetical protein
MKGYFKPKHPSKYNGDPTNIIYRSSWEKRCMIYFDRNDNVIKWSSEEMFVPYKHPITGKFHRYFPDFIIKVKNNQQIIETIMIEVKPHYQTLEPVKKSKLTKRYVTEVKTYAINKYKWDAAVEYCKDRKWRFQILTEKELGLD